MSNHTIEIAISPDGQHRDLRLDGTVYPTDLIVEALRLAPRYQHLVEAARAALAIASLGEEARAQLAPVAHQPIIARLLGHIADAETAVWGALAKALDGAL